MHKVLIVEDNAALIKYISIRLLKYKDEFEILTAHNGREAIDVLKKTTISLMVTDLKMPKMDGLALLAFMHRNYPQVPCIVITAHGTPEIKKRIRKDILEYIEKPIKADQLAETIRKALEIKDQDDSIRVISVANYLQLIEIEEKTCMIEVKSENHPKGLLYFEKGVLYDAAIGKLRGVKAALKLILFESSIITFKKLPPKKIKQRIHTSLSDLLFQAMRLTKGAEVAALTQEGKNKARDLKQTGLIKSDQEAPPENAAPSKTRNSNAFYYYLSDLQRIKGYKAAGLMNAQGQIEASDISDKRILLDEMRVILHTFFRFVKTVNHHIGVGNAKEMFCKASDGMILVAFTPPTYHTPIYTFAIFESGSNQTLVKLTLDKIIYRIMFK